MKSRARWALVLLLLAAGIQGFCQEEKSSKDLRADYDARKLIIQGTGYSPDPASLNWAVTHGYRAINEPTFLRIAGYEDLAQKSARHLLYQNSMLYGGLGVIIGGGIFSIYSIKADPYSPVKFYAGLGIIGVGTFIHILGYGPRHILPVGQAQKIADEYNQALLEEIFGDRE